MPRRSKRKQSKKSETTEEESFTEEVEQNKTTSAEESTQDDEPPSQKIPKLESDETVNPPAADEASSTTESQNEKEEESMVEENDDIKGASEKIIDSTAIHEPDEVAEIVESTPQTENEAADTIPDEGESVDANITEPIAQKDDNIEHDEPQKEEADASTDVKASEIEPMETQEGETAHNEDVPANLDIKGQADGEEDESSSLFFTIEKEPTVPYCYDDDSAEIAVDPEGDNGEVLIGNESPEFLKYWRAVLDNPQDFTNWTYLLQLVEQENKPSLARRAYNGFFKRYPLCYGYWKKFAELERRNGNYVRAQRILERGVRAIPLSIDLWVHTIDFYINHYKGPDAGQEKVRKLFERAANAAGEEFRSEKFWNKYLKWMKETKVMNDVMALYDRVLRLPTQHYAVYFKDFKEFVHSHSAQDLVDVDEFEKMLGEVRDDIEKKEQEKKRKEEERKKREKKDKDKASATENNEKEPPKPSDDDPPGIEKDDRSRPANEKEIKAVGEKIISKKKKLYEATEVVVTKIWTYEEGVKRPYFHVKALERTQIKNWRDYLEAEMEKGEENHRRTVLLFERCLIACALYEDFWLKYARYLMKVDPPKARAVYKRACEIHLPKKPNIHIHWSSFEEIQGNYQGAARILINLEKTLPNLLMVKLRRVAVERRAGRIEEAESLLKEYLANVEKVEEYCFLARKYAWFLVKVSKKVDTARQVLKDAIAKNRDEVQLYKDIVGLEFSHGNEESFCSACDLALDNALLTDEIKFLFSQRKMEYMEDFGTNPTLVQKAYDEHQKLYRSHKKRAQSAAEASQSKKTKDEDSNPTSGSKIETTAGSRQTYSAKPTTNGNFAGQAAAPQVTTAAQGTAQVYQQAATGDATSLYYQNYWNYQQKPEAQQQYQYGQWPQYSQTYYQQ